MSLPMVVWSGRKNSIQVRLPPHQMRKAANKVPGSQLSRKRPFSQVNSKKPTNKAIDSYKKVGWKAGFRGENSQIAVLGNAELRFDEQSPRYRGGWSVKLLIDEVPPAANCLRQQQGWSSHIGIMPKFEPPPGDVKPADQHRTNKATQNINATSAEVQHLSQRSILCPINRCLK